MPPVTTGLYGHLALSHREALAAKEDHRHRADNKGKSGYPEANIVNTPKFSSAV